MMMSTRLVAVREPHKGVILLYQTGEEVGFVCAAFEEKR
jgi:hypothetical protein